MKQIDLTKGYVTIVDDCDFDRVSAHHWQAYVRLRADGSTRIYAQGKFKLPNGNQKTHSLHRFIMDAPVGVHVDHIDGNPLNNCRANLRFCTQTENNRNMCPRTGYSSVYKGVSKRKYSEKWEAHIRINGRLKHIGSFQSEIEAANAYDAMASEIFGVFARVNIYPTKECL